MQISYNDIQPGDAVTIQVKCGMRVVKVTGYARWKCTAEPTWWKLELPRQTYVPCDADNFVSAHRVAKAVPLEDLDIWANNRPAWLRDRDERQKEKYQAPPEAKKQDGSWNIW